MYSMNTRFWTNEKLSLMVAWSSSVSISCFKFRVLLVIWFGFLIAESQYFLERTRGVLASKFPKSFMFFGFGFGILVFKITDSLKLVYLSSKSGPNDKR